MGPRPAMIDLPNRAVGNTEKRRYVARLFPRRQKDFDFYNVLVAQLRSAVLRALKRYASKSRKGVLDIVRASATFEIIKSVIGLHAVPVIDFRAVWLWCKECVSHKKVNRFGVLLSVLADLDSAVSGCFVRRDLEKPTNCCVMAFYSSKTAHGIKRELCNCFPNFFRVGILLRHAWPFSSGCHCLGASVGWNTDRGAESYRFNQLVQP